MGIVSLFSDMTHEGARSILGEFLNLTGASATTIGFVSGIGELLGYSLRIVSGFIADKTKKYWTIIIVGYSLQVLAIPALAFVPEQGWIIACVLIALERIGKAIKKPAKNTLVSFLQVKLELERICISRIFRSIGCFYRACDFIFNKYYKGNR